MGESVCERENTMNGTNRWNFRNKLVMLTWKISGFYVNQEW